MSSIIGSVISHYRLDAVLGEGGMGTVYQAYDLNLERDVSLKAMHAHFARQPEFRVRLEQEAKVAARLDHPSIVRILDFGQHDEILFIAMEYIGGGSLRERLSHIQSEGAYLPLEQSFHLCAQIASALDYAHSNGVIHRDVKPSNILLKRINRADDSGGVEIRAVLTDFGLVKLLEGDSMTKVGTTMGTPTYMSPEQCEGSPLDGRSDLYSLGVVLYELVTNQLPFEFKSLSEAMAAHMRGEMPAPAGQLRKDLPSSIESVLSEALAKNPKNRFVSGKQFADSLRSAGISLGDSQTQVMELDEGTAGAGEMAPEYRLRIEAPGQASSYAAMTQETINIGRHADNDIVLPVEGISRRNSSLIKSANGWQLEDLGGINGTKLFGRRLRPGEIIDIEPGSRIEIGPYILIVEVVEPEFVPILLVDGEDEGNITGDHVENHPADQPLALFIARDSLTVEPGKEVEILLEVVNRGLFDDRVNPKVQGLPANWVKLPDSFIEVPAGETAVIPLIIHPPRHTDSPAGRQRIRIELVSQRYGGMEPSITATLIVSAFESFEMTMEPRRIKLPEIVRVTVRNTGNGAADYSLVGRNPGVDFRISGERGRINLAPGQIATVDLRMDQRRRKLIGKKKESSFSVEVSTPSGALQSLRGKASVNPMFPSSIAYIFLFVIAFLCVLVSLVLIVQNSRSRAGIESFGIGLSELIGTPSSVLGTQTPDSMALIIAQQTFQAATAIASGDRDGDGLSDSQEEYLGTNPNVPDSDQDLLEDGEEVLIWSTNPLNRDSDGDKLSDGEEVRSIGTNPSNPDSDGDGIFDGDEVILGSDPLAGIFPSPTATLTMPDPTSLSTPETPTIAPSATTVPAETPTAPTPSTPSPEPIESPTAFATTITNETPVSTPTNTTTAQPTTQPAYVLACVLIPPLINGSIASQEWGTEPLVKFASGPNGDQEVYLYELHDSGSLYISAIIEDLSWDPESDTFAVFIDANDISGDPDVEDRRFEVGRNGTMTMWTGVGDNSDGENWAPSGNLRNWTAFFAELPDGSWSVELQIDLASEMPRLLLGPSFRTFVQVQHTEDQSSWPDEAEGTDVANWQQIAIESC
ncbi:MAG TPA: protein kinase [candidate division Zixibacteria bacterium]|nr:protein kinase [candidate division Zixibacteria bacterium]